MMNWVLAAILVTIFDVMTLPAFSNNDNAVNPDAALLVVSFAL